MEGTVFAFGKPSLWSEKAGLEAERLEVGRSMVQGAGGAELGSNSENGGRQD